MYGLGGRLLSALTQEYWEVTTRVHSLLRYRDAPGSGSGCASDSPAPEAGALGPSHGFAGKSTGCHFVQERGSCVEPFLKEFVKQKRFSSGWFRNGSAGRESRSLRVC